MLDGSEPSLSISQSSISNDLLGVVIGVTNSGYVIFEGKEPVGLGEYIVITNTDKKKILGVVESCLIKSDALDDISNFQEALESKTVAEINKRDKSFKINVKILGLLDLLKQSKVILPEIPPLPGTEVYKANKNDLEEIFNPEDESWLKVGTLLRNSNVNAKININKLLHGTLEYWR